MNQDSLILASDNQIVNILWNMSFLKSWFLNQLLFSITCTGSGVDLCTHVLD